jgi:MFS family permease
MNVSQQTEIPQRLLLLSFAESFAAILLERAFYFYTHDVLLFSDTQNLWLAFVFGVTYIAGAVLSHRVAHALGERSLLLASIGVLLLFHLALATSSSPRLLLVAFVSIGFLQGIKWPVIESFISAGRAPSELVRILGHFNTAWASAVPLALFAAGQLIDSAFPRSMFVAAAGLNALSLALSLPLPTRPEHHEVPPEPSAAPVERNLAGLLVSARWMLILSYALLFLLAPLMPDVFAKLKLSVSEATAATGVLDLARVAAFASLGVVSSWRGRRGPLIFCMVLLPSSFATVLFGGHVWLVLLGEIVFGLASGLFYMSSLYYALLLKNASVDAGGAHEGLIGLGFALGPLAGLLGQALSHLLGGFVPSILAVILPVMLLCTVCALRPLKATLGAS